MYCAGAMLDPTKNMYDFHTRPKISIICFLSCYIPSKITAISKQKENLFVNIEAVC
jgi:hypothetical protein